MAYVIHRDLNIIHCSNTGLFEWQFQPIDRIKQNWSNETTMLNDPWQLCSSITLMWLLYMNLLIDWLTILFQFGNTLSTITIFGGRSIYTSLMHHSYI